MDWCTGGAFHGANLGSFSGSSFTIGGQLQVYTHDASDWGSGSGSWMHYKIDSGSWVDITMDYGWKPDDGNNMFFQPGGSTMSTANVNISGLSAGAHTIAVKFGTIDGQNDNNGGNGYVANFTKVVEQAALTLDGESSTVTKTYAGSSFSLAIAGGSGDGALSVTKTGGTGTGTVGLSGANVTLDVTACGTFIIKVTKAASTGYLEKEQTFTVTVNKGTQTLTLSPTSKTGTYGTLTSYTITATHSTGDGALSYGSSDSGVATVNNSGTVTIQGAGSATITVTAAGTDLWDELSKTSSLTVNKGASVMSFSGAIDKNCGAADFTVTATLSSGDGAITYASDNESVATVGESSGVVHIVGPGTCNITATAAETSNWNSTSKSRAMTVKPAKPNKPTATAPSRKTVSVTWTAAAGAASYTVQIATDDGFTSVVETKTGVTGTSCTFNTGLSDSTTYYVHVKSVGGGQESAYSTAANTTTPAGAVAPTVGATSASDVTTSAATVSLAGISAGGATATVSFKYKLSSDSSYTDATPDPTSIAADVTGASSSVTLSGLTAGQIYDYQWTVVNSVDSTTATGSFATEPTAGTVTLTAATASSLKVTGKRSDGYGMLMVMKKGSAPTWTPTDGNTYTSVNGNDKALTAGTEVATGEYVVYNGTGGGTASGTGMTISGLDSGSRYYVKIYPYSRVSSAASTYNYNTTSPGSANAYTLSTEPTWSTPSLTATAASASQINLSWGAASGASGYVVVRKNGSSASTQAPSDGTSYSTGSGLGGTIVYVGSATSYNNTSLSAGTTYSYTVWAYNGVSGTAATYNYLTTGSATGTATTFASEPTGAPSLAVSARSTGSITLTVTKGTGASYTLVEAYTDGSHFAEPSDGTTYSANAAYGSAGKVGSYAKAVLAGSDGSVEVTGLSSGTIYYFKAYAYNGDGSSVPPNYYATGSTAVSAYTIASEPTWGTPSLTATASSASQIDLSWGAATGASGYLIVRKSGSTATTSEPADGSKYSAKSGETLIWVTSGSTTSTSDTGLSANTTYSYRIYAYKMTSGQDSTYNYLLGTELAKTATASDKTFAAKPTGAPSLSVNTRTVNSLKIDITKGANATYTLLEVYTDDSHFGQPVDGTTYSANAAWGSAGTVGSALAKVVCNDNSTSVTVTGLSAGTRYYFRAYSFNGNGSTTGKQSYYTTSYGSLDTAWTKPNAPTVGATVDGKTMIRLSATKNASGGTTGMVLVYGGSTAPTDGTAVPSKGASWAGGTVVWTGTANASGIEHVVASGTTHTYRLFAYAGSDTATAYSAAGTPASAPSTGSFGAEEIVDTFSYVSGSNLSGLNGEHGWSGAWSVSGTGPKIVSQTGSSIPQFPNYSEYPDNTGNRIKVAMNSDAANFAATREFPQVTSGNIFAAAIMSYHYAGNKKWCRIVLQNGDTAKMAAGRVWESGDDKTIGIDDCNGSRTHGSFELNPWESSVNNDYLVIMKYDFSSNMVLAKAYYHGAAVPTEEPTTWDVKTTLPASPGKLNKVSLQAGADSGGYTGDVYFDEVRVATSWTKLLARAASKPAVPTSFAATADGNELVRLSWALNSAGNGVMVLARTDGSNPTAPTDGTVYNEGGTVDANTYVIYKGTGTSLEHVVAAGSTTKYAIHSYNGDNWYSTVSASERQSVTTGTYPANCTVAEAFAYTNETYLTTSTGSQSWMNGGKGWAGAWSVAEVPSSEWSPGKAAKNGSGVEGLLETTQLSGAGGNMLALFPGTVVQDANKKAVLKRELTTALSSGSTWWGMFTMKITASAAKSWAGIQLLDASSNVKASIGKLWGGTTAGIEGSATGTSTYGVTAGHSYVYIFKWDGSKMWLHVQHVESTSDPNFSSYSTPAFTDADDTSVTLSMANIKYIQLVAENGRSGDSGTCVEDTWFDEIRFADSFAKMVGGSTTKPEAPGSLSATVDGKEMVRLSWTKNGAGNDVILVATSDGSTPASLTDNTSYSVDDTVSGTTKVLYKGGATEFEHVVLPGSTWKYKLFSDNGDNLYSASAATPGTVTAATGTYAAGEYVETFSYTNGVVSTASGNSWKGGTGFGANYWGKVDGTLGNWYPRKPGEVAAGMTAAVQNYPASAGNVLVVTNLDNNQSAVINRVASLPYGSNGSGADNTMYFAYRMAFGHSGTKRWAGLKIVTYDGGTPYTVFVGKAGDDTEGATLGIVAKSQAGVESKCWPLVGEGGGKYGLNGLSSSVNNTYLIVGKIRWTDTGHANIWANAYWTGGGTPELPKDEPSWGTDYWSDAKLFGVNSIQFEAGSSDTENKIGWAYFDELRFGGSWDELLAGTAPVAAWMSAFDKTVYLGDTTTHSVFSQPAGAKQSAHVLIHNADTTPSSASWDGAVEAQWDRNFEDGTHAGQMDTEWKAAIQWTSTGTRYAWGSATGNGTTVYSSASDDFKRDTYDVRVLPAPTLTASGGGSFRVPLSWDRGVGVQEDGTTERTFEEVLVIRYDSSADNLVSVKPADGTTYHAGDRIAVEVSGTMRYATVIYRGTATSYTDAGLARNTTYYYAAYTVNDGYYSARSDAHATTANTSATDPTIDGHSDDWVGTPSTVRNSSTVSEDEFIWTDKTGDERTDDATRCPSADIAEFRVKANADTVFFLVKLNGGAASTATNVHAVVGLDTRRSAESTAMNWLGDESYTFVGDGYWGDKAEHYARRQMAVHWVGAANEGAGAWQVEMYAEDGAEWYAPRTDWSAMGSANGSSDPCIEWKVSRKDLGLDETGTTVGRFTVATFVNSGAWNNQGHGTVRIEANSAAAVDAMEVVPYGVNDKDADLGAWDEGLKDANVNFWADVRFTLTVAGETKSGGLDTHTAPGAPDTTRTGLTPRTPDNGAGSPTLYWTASTDSDGFVTGYLVEVATNATFNGEGGGSENGSVLYRVNVKAVDGASYQTYKPTTSAKEFWWRVRARDSAGRLSTGTPRKYTVTGKVDADGPEATLKYVGTQVERFLNFDDPETGDPLDPDGAYRAEVERNGEAYAVLDSEFGSGDAFGFVIEWHDISGVYATNQSRIAHGGVPAGGFAWCTLSEDTVNGLHPYGRVSPNWDLILLNTNATDRAVTPSPSYISIGGVRKDWKFVTNNIPNELGEDVTVECWGIQWGFDDAFLESETLPAYDNGTVTNANGREYVTNWVTAKFQLNDFHPDWDLYLTLSAEDCNTNSASGGEEWYVWNEFAPTPNSWQEQAGGMTSGWCKDGPNPARNVTTNQLIRILVKDNDMVPPIPSTNKWAKTEWEEGETPDDRQYKPSLVVSMGTVSGTEWAQIGGKLARVEGQERDILYQLTDAAIAEAKPLTFLFNVYDELVESGVAHGTAGTDGTTGLTNTAFKIRSWNPTADSGAGGWDVSDENTDMYAAGKSSIRDLYYNSSTHAWEEKSAATSTRGTGPSTVLSWTFADSENPLTEERLADLFGMDNILDYIGHHSDGVTNLIQLHAWDLDNNRTGVDQANAEITFGRLLLSDDDATAPVATNLTLLGTGTNRVAFGSLAVDTFSQGANVGTAQSPKYAVLQAFEGKQLGSEEVTQTPAGVVARSKGPGGGTGTAEMYYNPTKHVAYMEGGMNGATHAANSKYFEWTVSGSTADTYWLADTLTFSSYVTAFGPTRYWLTYQDTVESAIYNPESEADKLVKWTVYNNGSAVADLTSITDANGLQLKGTASVSDAYVQAAPIDLTSAQSVEITASLGAHNTRDARTITIQYKWTEGGSWQNLNPIASTALPLGSANPNLNEISDTIDHETLSGHSTLYVRWYASGVNATKGFRIKNPRLVVTTGTGGETQCGEAEVVKEEDGEGKYLESSTEVSIAFTRAVENRGRATKTFRLYGYRATGTVEEDASDGPFTGGGNWGINNLTLHGIVSAPKGVEVTDEDLHTASWTNTVEVSDGMRTGYDTVRSGLWVADDGVAGRTQKTPEFTVTYPDSYSGHTGEAFWTGRFNIPQYAEAELTDKAVDFSTAPVTVPVAGWQWNVTGSAVREEGTTPSGWWLSLPANSSADGMRAQLDFDAPANGLEGVSVTVVAKVRSLVPAGSAEARNGFKVRVEYLDGSGDPLDLVEEQTFSATTRWGEYTLGPYMADTRTARSAVVTLVESGTDGTGLQVDEVRISMAVYGTLVHATPTAADNGTIKSAKLQLGTSGQAPTKDMELSHDGTDGWKYTMTATVYDYDHDRTSDALGGDSSYKFRLYDDDDVAPSNGAQFGGPFGVKVDGTLLGSRYRVVGNGRTNLVWSLSDNYLAGLAAAGKSLEFHVDYYDYSGWRVTALNYQKLASGGGASGAAKTILSGGTTNAAGTLTDDGANQVYARAAGNTDDSGAANVPSATVGWTQDALKFYRAHAGDFGDAPVTNSFNATVVDMDCDRTGDSIEVTEAVGNIRTMDQDVKAPYFRPAGEETAKFRSVLVATNVPSFEALKTQAVDAEGQYAIGGYAAQQNTTNAAGNVTGRTHVLYDSKLLESISGENHFVVSGDIVDRSDTAKGRASSGVRRGTTKTDSGVSSVLETSTFTMNNSYLGLLPSGGGDEVSMEAAYNSGWSCSDGDTKMLTSTKHSSWVWPLPGTPASELTNTVAQWLPSWNNTKDWTLTFHVWDNDVDRANDQTSATLTGPVVRMRDDDTKEPGDPGSVTLAGVPASTWGSAASINVTRDNAVWTNNPSFSGVTVAYTAATDQDGRSTADANGLPDIAVSGIGGYRMMMKTVAEPDTRCDRGIALGGAETLSKTGLAGVMGETPVQGLTTQLVFAVDADADRPDDAMPSAGVPVGLGLDTTDPTPVNLGLLTDLTDSHAAGASTDSVDDPTTQFHVTWHTDGVGPDDNRKENGVFVNDDYKAIPAALRSSGGCDILSKWRTFKVYYRVFDAATAAGQVNPAGWVYNQYVAPDGTDSYKLGGDAWKSVTVDTTEVEDPSAGANPYAVLGSVTPNVTWGEGGRPEGVDANLQRMTLYDLDFDQEYVVVVVGVDKAGNEGPAGMNSWATNDTIKFAVTQGVIRARADINADVRDGTGTGMTPIPTDTDAPKRGAALYWMAAGQTDGVGEVKKEYDLIYRDAPTFDERGTEQWNLVGTVRTNWNYQTDGLGTVDNNLRFFRASYAGRWRGEKPLASEEVYSMNNVVLSEGFNYVSLQGVPWANTFAGVFGTDTDMWPPNADSPASTNGAVVIEFYKSGTGAQVQAATKEQYFFASDGKWWKFENGEAVQDVTTVEQSGDFFMRPFSINLPNAKKADGTALPWWTDHNDTSITATKGTNRINAILWHPILQVPTNGVVAAATASTSSATPGSRDGAASESEEPVFRQQVKAAAGTYNTLSLNLPVSVHPRQLGLVLTNSSGGPLPGQMKASNRPSAADKLYVIDTGTKEIRRNSTMYCDGQGQWRFSANTNSLVPEGFIRPNDMLILISAGGNGEGGTTKDWNWTYRPSGFYTNPTRHMGR